MPEEQKDLPAPMAPTPTEQPNELLVSPIETEGGIDIWPDDRPSQFLTCLDPVKEEYMLLNAEGKADALFWDHVELPVEVNRWYVHSVRMPNMETGELERKTRLVCWEPSGKSWSTTSGPAINLWRSVLQKKGNGPYHPPLIVQAFKVKSSKNAGHYMQFRFLPPPEILQAAPAINPESEKPSKKRRTA